MLDSSFQNPNFRQIVERVMFNKGTMIPSKLTKSYIKKLFDKEIIVNGRLDISKLLEQIENVKNNIILIPEQYKTIKEESDYILKNLIDTIHLDSSKILEDIVNEEESKGRIINSFREHKKLTYLLAQELKLWPYTLLKKGLEKTTFGSRPLGYCWYGLDGYLRVISWIREVEGAELYIAKNKLNHKLELATKGKFYGKNARLRITSRSKKDKEYEFDLTDLPIFKSKDLRQYSSWLEFKGYCNCPDKGYRSRQHEKRARDYFIFCAHEVAGFYEAMHIFGKRKGFQFRINPFGIPTKRGINFVDNLRWNCAIKDNDKIKPLNKTEMDRLIGDFILYTDYDNVFYHWGKKKPENYIIKTFK